jgi:2-keto-4-pentenoate hydratase/2-oxohepta-3-ene-1,7-dioic acid hydratase in catechol pathway
MTRSIKVGEKKITPCRIFCIGKNYEDHIRELDDSNVLSQPKEKAQPVVFMKPVTSIVPLGELIHVPLHGRVLHHEVEVVVLLNGGGQNVSPDDAISCISGVTLGLDLTLRDIQIEMKKKGCPWELSKSFDHSSPLGSIRVYDNSFDLFNLPFTCFVNGRKCQEGNNPWDSEDHIPCISLLAFSPIHKTRKRKIEQIKRIVIYTYRSQGRTVIKGL